VSWALRVSIAAIRERADWAIKVAKEETQEAERARSVQWYWEPDRSRVNLHAVLPADMGMRVTSVLDRIARRLPVSPEAIGADDPFESEDDVTLEARRADALDLLAAHAIASDSDADRATVVVHAPLSALVDGSCNGVSSSGHALAPEVLARLTCGARVQGVVHAGDGGVIGIGHTSRLIPRWLRRQVEQRDGFRCTFPNCESRLGLDVHHVVPWPHGPTNVDNLTLVCRVHHRLVHEHGWHVMLAKDQSARWFRPDWTPYVPRGVGLETAGDLASARRERVPGDDEAPRDVVAAPLAEPNASGLGDVPAAEIVRERVLGQPEAAPAQEGRTVVAAVDAHRLAEARGAGRDQAIVGDVTAQAAHRLGPEDGLAGAQQDRLAHARPRAHDVGAPVHAVGEIDVQVRGRAVHGLGPRGRPAITVGAGIDRAAVRLELDEADADAADRAVVDEETSDEIARDGECIALIERLREPLRAGRRQLSSQARSAF
jgi:hypothetical protein